MENRSRNARSETTIGVRSRCLLELLFCSIVALAVFLLRDAYLLSGYAPVGITARCLVYAALVSGYDLLAVKVAAGLSPSAAADFIAAPRVWATALLIHGLLAALGWWCRSLPSRNCQVWWLAVLPAPIQMLAAGALAKQLSLLWGTRSFTLYGIVPAWTAGVLILVVAFRALDRDHGDADFTAEFAQVTNVMGLAVLPFRQLLGQAQTRMETARWTLLVVVAAPATAALLTLLFRKRAK